MSLEHPGCARGLERGRSRRLAPTADRTQTSAGWRLPTEGDGPGLHGPGGVAGGESRVIHEAADHALEGHRRHFGVRVTGELRGDALAAGHMQEDHLAWSLKGLLEETSDQPVVRAEVIAVMDDEVGKTRRDGLLLAHGGNLPRRGYLGAPSSIQVFTLSSSVLVRVLLFLGMLALLFGEMFVPLTPLSLAYR